jgi:uncharacterized membrane protein YfcA
VIVSATALAVLCGAAACAGFVDAIAGGGGLVTVPALMTFVPSPHLALGTNKGQALFGAISSAVSFWRGDGVDRHRVPLAFACGATGAVIGALLQLRVKPEPLKPIALALLVAAAALVALRPLVLKKAQAHDVKAPNVRLAAIALAIGCYDGFFGPGTGSLLIVAFVTIHGDAMTRASGNAKVVNLASNIASFIIFAIKGTILWSIALPMALANAIGAAAGARVAMKRGDAFVRVVVLVVVVALVVKLGVDVVR